MQKSLEIMKASSQYFALALLCFGCKEGYEVTTHTVPVSMYACDYSSGPRVFTLKLCETSKECNDYCDVLRRQGDYPPKPEEPKP